MKLSEAMMLGSVTCKMIPVDINSCALGAAANAIGIPRRDESEDPPFPRYNLIKSAWPWLIEDFTLFCGLRKSSARYMDKIMDHFDADVCEKKMTFEQLVDYVASIEPECGECNEFVCNCARPESGHEAGVLVGASA